MKKSVAAAIMVVVALAGAAVAAVPIVERHAAQQIKREIERDGVRKVDEVEVGLFDRRIKLVKFSSAAPTEVTVGRWEVSGLAWPLDELLRGRTPLAGLRWGDPLRAERMELDNVLVSDRAGGTSWRMDSLTIDGFDLARFDARGGEPAGLYRHLALIARAMGALSLRRLEERNAIFILPTGDMVGVASVVVERYERGRVAAVTMAALEATAKRGQAPLYSVANIKAGEIDLRRMVAALSSDGWLPGAPVGRVTVDNATISGFGGEALRKYGISLGEATIETDREGDSVMRARARLEGFVLAPPLRGLEALQVRLALQTMGLKEVKADFDCSFTEDRAKGEVALERCALIGPGLGEIDLSGRIVGADKAFWQAIDDGDTTAMYDSKVALASARLVVADKSLLERSLKALASVTGQPVAMTRANLARDIRRYQPAGVLISLAMTQALDTVARFVEQGGTLTIDAKPEPPLALDRLEYLSGPGADLVAVLGLRASLTR